MSRYPVYHASLALLASSWFCNVNAQVLTVRPMPAVPLIADALSDVNQMPKLGDVIGSLEATRLTINSPAWQDADREIHNLVLELRKLLPKHLAGLSPQPWDYGYGPSNKRQRILADYLSSTKSEGMGDPGAITKEEPNPRLDLLFEYAPVLKLVPKQLLLKDFLYVQSEMALRNLFREEQLSFPDLPAAIPTLPIVLEIPRGRRFERNLRRACSETAGFIEKALASVPSSHTVQALLGNAKTVLRADDRPVASTLVKAFRDECSEFEAKFDRHSKALSELDTLSLSLLNSSDGHVEYAVNAKRSKWHTEERLLSEGISRRDIANLPKRWIAYTINADVNKFDAKLQEIGLSDQEREQFRNAIATISAFSKDDVYLGTYVDAVEYEAPSLTFTGRLFRAVSDWYYVDDGRREWRLKSSSRDPQSIYNRLVARLNDADREYFMQVRDAALGTTGALKSAAMQAASVSARARLESTKRRIYEDVVDALDHARRVRERTRSMAATNWAPESGAIVASVNAVAGTAVQPGTVLLSAFPASARAVSWKAPRGEAIVGQVSNVQFASPPTIPLPPNVASGLSWLERQKVASLLSDISKAVHREARLTLTVTALSSPQASGEVLGILEHRADDSYDVTEVIGSSTSTQKILELLFRADMAYRVDGRVLFRPACGFFPVDGKVNVKPRQ